MAPSRLSTPAGCKAGGFSEGMVFTVAGFEQMRKEAPADEIQNLQFVVEVQAFNMIRQDER
jgi:hypothetical protein